MIASSSSLLGGYTRLAGPTASKQLPENFKPLEPKSIDEALAGRIADNDPRNIVATITKNGEVFAEVYKSGLIGQPNKFAITEPPPYSGGTEKERVDARIAQLLRISGGEVNYSNSLAPAEAGGSVSAKPSASASFFAQLLSSKW